MRHSQILPEIGSKNFVTVKARYNEVLGITNDFLYPSNSKIDGKEPRYDKNSLYSELSLPVPWFFVVLKFHCIRLALHF